MTNAKRAAIAAYKKRESPIGIFAVRCPASGDIWVGQALDLEKIQNRIWFSLRLGVQMRPTLQQAWRTHGEEGLSFEIVERLEAQESAYTRDALLTERLAFWRARLTAQAV